jgi:hypothetical protein
MWILFVVENPVDKAVDITVDSDGDICRMSNAAKRAGAVLGCTVSGAFGPASTVSRETVQSQFPGAVYRPGRCADWHIESSKYGFLSGDSAHTPQRFPARLLDP